MGEKGNGREGKWVRRGMGEKENGREGECLAGNATFGGDRVRGGTQREASMGMEKGLY